VTRAALSEALGREVSRDVLARLKRIGLIGGGPRVAQAGAPLTYVTTRRFLSVFGLATLRDLPEIEGMMKLNDEQPTPRDEWLPGDPLEALLTEEVGGVTMAVDEPADD
jgi:chromosome segregation and condensation protein ScpB